MKRFAFLALPALALVCMLSLPETSFAQRRGGGGYNNGYYGGYRNGGYYNGGYYRPGVAVSVGGVSVGVGGYPYYGYGRGYYAPYYAQPYVYSSPYVVAAPPAYVGGVATASYQSSYPPDGAVQGATDPARASIRVRVPANAQVFFDDTPTSQTGPERMFVTGPLDSGNYSYTISARWMDNGQERRETRNARLIRGQTVDVDFTTPAPQQIR